MVSTWVLAISRRQNRLSNVGAKTSNTNVVKLLGICTAVGVTSAMLHAKSSAPDKGETPRIPRVGAQSETFKQPPLLSAEKKVKSRT